jgi:hypothetical protein
MRPPWLRALTGCLQMVVRSADDIEVEAGEVDVGQLRERAFLELCEVLDPLQRASFIWLALADLAVWPQLPSSDAMALAAYLDGHGSLPLSTPRKIESLADVGRMGTIELLPLIDRAKKIASQSLPLEPNELRPILKCVNGFAKNSDDSIAYWEKWLRRVIPAVVTHDVAASRTLALAALRSTLNTPSRWLYLASQDANPEQILSTKGLRVNVVAPDRRGRSVQNLGEFVEIQPVNRRIEAKLIPAAPIDPYRMGYLFRSVCITDFFDDLLTGHYESVCCTNMVTGDRWDYSKL